MEIEMEVLKGKGKGTRDGKRSRTGIGRTTATVERMRRQHMKQLCAKLASLIPNESCSTTDTMTQLSSLDEAAKYIKKLKERVDELRQRRSSTQAMATLRGIGGFSTPTTTTMSGGAASSELEGEKGASSQVVEVRQHDDSSMEVVLICDADRPVKLHKVITVLEEEGASIINANYSVAGQKIFYSIHSRVRTYKGLQLKNWHKRFKGF